MNAWPRRTLRFAGFAFREYVRSGRVLVEFIAAVVLLRVFFWPRGAEGLPLAQFLNIAGLFVFALAAYTTIIIMGLGNRPQGYVFLARPLGRSGYLAGLYLAALAVIATVYVGLSLVTVALQRFYGLAPQFTLKHWLLGSLPLFLDVAIIAAFVTLLVPLVMPAILRLLLLAVIAASVTTDLELLGRFDVAAGVLHPLKMLFALALMPVARGFALAHEHRYDRAALETLLGQLALALILICLAQLVFHRRDIVLRS